MKTCKSCKETKDLCEFSTSGKSRKGTVVYAVSCKKCRALQGREERSAAVNRVCSSCGTSWKSNGGSGKRGMDLCDICYKAYRKAYNIHHAAKTRAKNKKIKFDIPLDYVFNKVRYGTCDKTGLHFNFTSKGQNYSDRHMLTPSIDKIDPNGAYVVSNIQIVCWWYNSAKARFTDEEVLDLCKAVVNHSL